ncbi:MAG TPA: hydroxymethylbilane synthase [Thermoplasmata archaeon]|nr:hydroxymethylbilane synthase [Thermoplasmata archaeon]
MSERIRVGTRRSPLARVQTELVLAQLRHAAGEWRFVVVPIDTTGDQSRSLGGSPDFTDRIDRSLLRGEIDLAIHSAKDLPVELDPRFELVACPRRADPRDCLVIAPSRPPTRLARGARVGSSSLRRRAQLLRWRPDLAVVEIRGNVDTRIDLVRSGSIDAAILAVAGILRLGRAKEIGRILPTSRFVPSPAQGALAVVARAGDAAISAVVRRIDRGSTHACVTAERTFAAALGGDCRVPLGALATVHGRTLSLVGEVLSPDGRAHLRSRGSGPIAAAERIGSQLGRAMLDRGAHDLWSSVRR